MVVLVLVSTALSAQINYFASGDRALSAFVRAEYFIWTPGEIELLVLWRGSNARWYSGSGSKRGGGTAQGYEGSVQFGQQQFDFSYDRERKVARIRNVESSLAEGQNVLFVDGADRDGDPSINAIRSDLRYPVVAGRGSAPAPPGSADIVAILSRSPQMVPFLRCTETVNDQIPARASGYVCADLKGR